MKVSAYFHLENGYFGENVEFDFLKDLTKKKFWQARFMTEIKNSCEELTNKLDNLREDLNTLTITTSSGDVDRYTRALKESFSGFNTEVFIPEFVELNLDSFDTLEKIKELCKNGINVYVSEFDYRSKKRWELLEYFRPNQDIMQEERLKEITDGNSTVIKNLSLDDIKYLKSFLNRDNIVFDPNELKVTQKEGTIDPLHGKLKNLKEYESFEYFTQNKENVTITAVPCFLKRPLAYVNQNGYLVTYDEENYLLYESGYSSPDMITIVIDGNMFVYSMSCWGDFIKLIDNFKGLKNKISDFPKYEMFDTNYQDKLKKHLGLTHL